MRTLGAALFLAAVLACGGGGGDGADPGPVGDPGPGDAGTDAGTDAGPVVGCGNLACEPGEDCLDCPGDCACRCGDGVCTLGEKCASCPGDCDCTTLMATPPMGWNTWNKFGCDISDALIRETADALVTEGMLAAGYEYLNLDDCWQADRAPDGTILLDPDFAPGMKDLGDYVHGKGLKYGVYTCAGTMTCQKRAGSLDHESRDMKAYASWGVDYVKVDWCFTEGLDPVERYAKFRDGIRDSGRQIVLSICNWGVKEPWVWGPQTGQLWRTTGDISDIYLVMLANLLATEPWAAAAGPGHWNDPDMLEIGNGAMTRDEYRTHMALWAVSAAPLIAGHDLRTMDDWTRELLLNPEVIAVDQDPAGVQGVRVRDDPETLAQVWARPVTLAGARAVVLFNGGMEPQRVEARWSDLGLAAGPAKVRDLFAREDRGSFDDAYGEEVPPHGSAFLLVVGREPVPPAGESFVSDLPWVHSAGGMGPVERDRSNGGTPRGDGKGLAIRGRTYARGIGANAPAMIVVHLGGRCTRFRADVGIDDQADGAGTAVFQVRVDGQVRFDSGVLTGKDGAKAVDVALDGARELTLFADAAGDTAWRDFADWADARLDCR